MELLASDVVERFNVVSSFFKKRLPTLANLAKEDPSFPAIQKGNSLLKDVYNSPLRDFPKLVTYGHPIYNDFIVRNALGITRQVDSPYPSNNSSLSKECQEHIANAVADWYSLFRHEIVMSASRSILAEARLLPVAGKHVRNYAYQLSMAQLSAVERVEGFREYTFHLLKPTTRAQVARFVLSKKPDFTEDALVDLKNNFFTEKQLEAAIKAANKVFIYKGFDGLPSKAELSEAFKSDSLLSMQGVEFEGKPYATYKHDLIFRVKEATKSETNYNVWAPIFKARSDYGEYTSLPVLWSAVCYLPGLYSWNKMAKPDFGCIKKVLAICCKDKYTKYRLVFFEGDKINTLIKGSKFDTFKVMVPPHFHPRAFNAALCFENKGKLFGWMKAYNPFHFVW